MQKVPFRGRITEEEYVKLYCATVPGGIPTWLLGLILVLVTFQLWRWSTMLPAGQFALACLLTASLLGGIYEYFRRSPERQAREIWRTIAKLGEVSGEVRENGISWMREEQKGEKVEPLPWSGVLRYQEFSDFVLIYPRQGPYLAIMRSYFSSQETWEAGLGLIRKHAATSD